MRNNFNFPNPKTPWYLSSQFFSLFFGVTIFLIVASFLIQGAFLLFGAKLILNQDFSKGIIPIVEKALCGEPKCLKGYFQ